MRAAQAEIGATTADANLGDPRDRARLSAPARKALIRIAEIWELGAADVCRLLGGISERSWYRLKEAPKPALSQDMLTRASALVGIFKGLRLLFSQPLADEWVRRPNRHPIFGGRTPLAAMEEGGIPKMLEVRAYIDALRGGL